MTWNQPITHRLLLLFAGACLFLVNLGAATLWDLDEGRNATAALEMSVTGRYVVPNFNGQLRVDKPALLYWLQVVAYRVFGVNEFAARLPSALAALLTLLLCYELGRSLFNPFTGLVGGLIAASSPMLVSAARFANPDALLNCFTVMTFYVFWRGRSWPRSLWFMALGTASALAVLAKGPVGLILPSGVAISYLLWQRQLGLIADWRLRWGVLSFGIVALPWYVMVAIETRLGFIEGFIMNHNVNRFLSTMEAHQGSSFYYVAVLLVGLAPWSIFLPLALWYAFWSLWSKDRLLTLWNAASDRDREASFSAPIVAQPPVPSCVAPYRFLAAWILLYLVFFTMSATKLPNYILPVVIPCALLIARCLDRWRLSKLDVGAWAMPFALLILAFIGIAASAGLIVASGTWPLQALHGRFLPGMEYWALIGLVPVCGAVIAYGLLRRERRTAMIAVVVVSANLFVGALAAWVATEVNDMKAPASLVAQSGAFQPAQDIRVGIWHIEHLPSLNFYVQREVNVVSDAKGASDFLHSPLPVYLFLPANDWSELQPRLPARFQEIARHRDLYRADDVVVVTNGI